jgi:hypothetical protein
MKNSTRKLIATFEEHIDRVGKAMEQFPLEDAEMYATWLAQTYCLVRHSTRLLTIAASNAPLGKRDLHYDMIHHLKGELHHDQIALNDLKGLGYEPSQFPELVATSALYQTQYYWLEHEDVSSLMGYALLLEGLASKYGSMLLERTKGHGKKATAFLRLHCEVDLVHYADGLKSLAQYEDHEHPAIVRNLEQSCRLYLEMASEVAQGKARPACSPVAA